MPTAALYPPAERTGEPVPVSGRTCALDRIHSATEGVWNGVPVTKADMQAMAENFAQFSSGESPYYQPFISLNHDDPLNCGIIVGADFDGTELHLDGDNIPEEVGAWVNGGRLHGASIEFWEPKYDDTGNLVGTFMTPDGTYSATPVIKCLSLLGNQAPGMKGMAQLPTARFSDSHQPQRFGTMNRDELIAALAAQGFDASKLTDLDTLLQYLVDCKAKPSDPTQTPTPTGDPNENAQPIPMADLGAGSVGAPAVAGTGGGAGIQPTSLTLKFNDSAGKPVTGTVQVPNLAALLTPADRQALDYLRRNGTAIAQQMKNQADAAKRTAIQAFGDRLAAANVPPATINAQKAVLAAMDHMTVRKFADGKNSGTQLEEAIRTLEAGAVPGTNLAEKIKPGNGQGQTVAPANENNNGTGTDWNERKNKMLENDPLFASAKRKQEKAATK